jgi:hypothetical protein
MTEPNEPNERAAITRENLRRAFVKIGRSPSDAAHLSELATVSVLANGVVVDLGGLRSLDSVENLGELASRLTRGEGSDGVGYDPVAAGRRAAEEQKKLTRAGNAGAFR